VDLGETRDIPKVFLFVVFDGLIGRVNKSKEADEAVNEGMADSPSNCRSIDWAKARNVQQL
jgi:hypothetical protein